MNQARIAAGVTFDRDVLEYLRRLCQEHQRNRSFIIYALIREHARQPKDRTRKAEPGIRY